jgi:hypothetical protein
MTTWQRHEMERPEPPPVSEGEPDEGEMELVEVLLGAYTNGTFTHCASDAPFVYAHFGRIAEGRVKT